MSLPCGTRNYDYAEDMSIVRTKTHWVLLICFFILLFAAPLYFNNYWLGVCNLIGITLVAAVGLNILVGYCGQLSIGHAGFIAVGAYTAAILTNRLELPFLVMVPQLSILVIWLISMLIILETTAGVFLDGLGDRRSDRLFGIIPTQVSDLTQ